jgi:hypothetical protein
MCELVPGQFGQACRNVWTIPDTRACTSARDECAHSNPFPYARSQAQLDGRARPLVEQVRMQSKLNGMAIGQPSALAANYGSNGFAAGIHLHSSTYITHTFIHIHYTYIHPHTLHIHSSTYITHTFIHIHYTYIHPHTFMQTYVFVCSCNMLWMHDEDGFIVAAAYNIESCTLSLRPSLSAYIMARA